MNQSFYQAQPTTTVIIPEVGTEVRVWMRPDPEQPVQPEIIEGTVRAVYVDDGQLQGLTVITNELRYVRLMVRYIGSIELA